MIMNGEIIEKMAIEKGYIPIYRTSRTVSFIAYFKKDNKIFTNKDLCKKFIIDKYNAI